jgi:UDP-glucose 4-epimerase
LLKALITGGAGFIGSHVVERFLAAGYEVQVVDDLSSGKRENLPAAPKLHVLDVRSDEVAALVRSTQFDVIAHLAAQIDVRKSVENPRFDADINIGGTLNLLETLRGSRDGRKCRFVFVSTGGALYGEAGDKPSGETTPQNPDSPYGIAKLAAEHYTASYARVHGLDTAVARLGNIYGPRQDPLGEAGVVAIFCHRLTKREPLTVYGDGEQLRDYVYVVDVARAIFAIATSPLPAAGPLDARAFNVGTGNGTSVLTLAKLLGQSAGVEPVLTFAPKRAGELQRSVLDASKAARLLNWRPSKTIEEGLAETYAWEAGHAG